MGTSTEQTEFAEVLDAAFRAAATSSAAMARALREEGHEITGATLSYWRSGRRKPGRHASVGTIRRLEQLLDLESGALLAHVPRAPDRGTTSRRKPLGVGREAYAERVLAMREALGLPEGAASRTLLAHETAVLDAAGIRRRHETYLVMEARVDGLRSVVIGQVDHAGADGPGVVDEIDVGTIGAVAVDRDLRILMTRVDLPVPFQRMETFAVRSVTHYPHADARLHGQERWSDYTMREYVLNLRFDPGLLPVHLEAFAAEDALADAPGARVRHPVLHGHTAQAVFLDVPPGSSAVRWHFADEDPEVHAREARSVPAGSAAVRRAWQEFTHPREIPLPPRAAV